jgi:hypothetical protein
MHAWPGTLLPHLYSFTLKPWLAFLRKRSLMYLSFAK